MLLGPCEVRCGDGLVAVARPRQRAVLAYLLLSANQVVTAHRLVEAMWGGAAPSTAKAQIQADVSAIRRAFRAANAPDRVATEHAGYRILVGPGELDLAEFSALTQAAREAADQPPMAASLLRQALAQWRGPALEDVSAAYADATRASLEDRRLAAYEELADIELLLGHEADLVAELSPLVQAHPARERLCGHLMTALYRTGRQADSLRVARQLRQHLADHHGLDPAPFIQRLEQMILCADPALRQAVPSNPSSISTGPTKTAEADIQPQAASAPPRQTGENRQPDPAQLPATAGGFTGREEQIARLDALLPGDRVTGTTTLVIAAIAGTGGVGKTALAVWWASRVARLFPDGQFFVNLQGFGPVKPVRPLDALGGFLRALGIPGHQIPVDEHEAAALYRTRLAGRRALIVLDNACTAEQVRPLLPGSPGCMVVVTSRNTLSGLIAAEGAQALALDLLPAEEAQELLAHRLGADRVAAEAEAVAEIIASCARLPLALAIVAARAATNPGFTLTMLAGELRQSGGGLDAFAGSDPATDVRTVFSWSYHLLSADAARLFRLLGVHGGPDIATAAAASLAGIAQPGVRALLTELARAHLVSERTPGRYALHDLLRAYATELAHVHDTETDRRAALHRMLDHYLHTAHTAALLLNPSRDPITVAPARSGTVPENLTDHGQALAWFTIEQPVLLAAIGQAATAFDTHAWQLAWTLVNFFARRGHWHESAATQRTALDAARRLADPLAQALAHRSLAAAYAYLNRYDDAHSHYHQALDLFSGLGDRSGQAQTHRGLGWMMGRQGRHQQALHHTEQALELSRDDPAAQASALNAVGWYHAQLGDHSQSVTYCRRALTVLQETGDRWGQANTWDSLGYAHHHLGDQGQAATCYQQAVNLYREIGDRYPESRTLIRVGEIQHATGDLDAARQTWQHALKILEELEHPEADQLRAKLDRHDAQTRPSTANSDLRRGLVE